MGLKRAYCVKCHTNNEKTRIFDVNPEATVCYCPHCMAEYNPQDAIRTYDLYIQKKIDSAFKTLYEETEYQIAYNKFARILEIDKNAIEARFGRILSLIYLSTLRRSRFADAAMLLKEESVLYFRKKSAFQSYAKFLTKASLAVDEYADNFRKRLSVKTYYYDDECIKLMYCRLRDVIKFKESLLQECEFLSAKYENDELATLVASLSEQIKNKTNELNAKVIAVDGYTYGLASFNNNGSAILGHNAAPDQIRVKHFRRKSLGNEEKRIHVISDEVYPNNVKIAHFIKKVIPWEILSAILCIAAASLIFVFKDKEMISLIMMIVAGSLFSLVCFFVIMQITGNYRIKKRRHLIK